MAQIGFGPRIRRSPFFEASIGIGATHFTVYNKMYMPVAYGDVQAEYDRLINGVAMWDVASERQIRIQGKDALQLVRILTPRNLEMIEIGKGRYVPICDHRGTLINDPVLLPVAEDEYWLSIADSDLILWVRAVAAERGFKVQIDEPDISPLAIQGPKAVDVVSSLLGDWVRDLKHFWFKPTKFNGIPLIVAKSGWSKQGGFELYLMDGTRGTELWNAVAEAGLPYAIGPGAPSYMERIESGLLSVGADTDDASNPFELGMSRLVDVDQEINFIGKEALKRIAQIGPKRILRGFVIDGEPFNGANQTKWPVFDDEQNIGQVSAGAFSPRFKNNIGLGLVGTDFCKIGNVRVETEFGTRNARLTDLPFTDASF